MKTDNHPYIFLWLLLSISLVIIVAIAFIDEPSIMGLSIKQAPYKEALLADVSQDYILSDTITAEENIEEIETDSVPKKILIFGDSMTYILAQRMAKYGGQNGHEVYGVNWDSSTPSLWASSDTLQYFIKKYNIDFVMVSLGSNELFTKNVNERAKYIRGVVKRIGNIPFIWIGPPNWKEDNGYNDMLMRTLPKGTFFKTSGMELQRRNDHIHPTQAAANLWVDSIMRWMPSSAHPILSDYPADSIKTRPTLILLKKK